MNFGAFPGSDLVHAGLRDLALGIESQEALLVSIGAPRLERLGVHIASPLEDSELRLYAHLAAFDSDSAHSRYNALIRRLVSFERAAECAPVDRARIEKLMDRLADSASAPLRVYLVGGSSAVLIGWRNATVDVDFALRPSDDAFLRAIPDTKNALDINIELASPADFIPLPAGWEDRSPLIARRHHVAFHHFDFYSQALAKLERGHRQDVADVRAMRERGLIDPSLVQTYFDEIEPELFRFPAIDPPAFRRAVATMVAEH